MKVSKFLKYVRKRTKTTVSSFSSEDIMDITNIQKDEVAKAILLADEDQFVVPMTTDLVSGQREYPFVSDMLSRLKYAEIKFDTDSDTDYIRLREVDQNMNGYSTNENFISHNFSNEDPFFDIIRSSIWILSGSVPSVTAGLKVWCTIFPANYTLTDFTDLGTSTEMDAAGTTSVALPRQFHKVLADLVVRDYKLSNGIDLDLIDEAVENNLKLAVSSIKNTNLDRAIVPPMPTGDEGNNGYDF